MIKSSGSSSSLVLLKCSMMAMALIAAIAVLDTCSRVECKCGTVPSAVSVSGTLSGDSKNGK
jgi:hypothetical protein